MNTIVHTYQGNQWPTALLDQTIDIAMSYQDQLCAESGCENLMTRDSMRVLTLAAWLELAYPAGNA